MDARSSRLGMVHVMKGKRAIKRDAEAKLDSSLEHVVLRDMQGYDEESLMACPEAVKAGYDAVRDYLLQFDVKLVRRK